MEEATHPPAAGEVVEIDASVCNDDSGIEVFAPTVEPVSGATEAAKTSRGKNLLQRMRDWLRRLS
jgi:hypothetical protein